MVLRLKMGLEHDASMSHELKSHVRSLSKVHSILKLFSKHTKNANIMKQQKVLLILLCEYRNELTLFLTFVGVYQGVMSLSLLL
jgi:hypothetical protein